MSYDITFGFKTVDGEIKWNDERTVSITYNLREMLDALNLSVNGHMPHREDEVLAFDYIDKVYNATENLIDNVDKYKKYEPRNGWGSALELTNQLGLITDEYEDNNYGKFPKSCVISWF